MKRKKIYRSILFWLLLVVLVRMLMLDTYMVTSSSMEGTLLTGDVVVINKMKYGPKLPEVISIPFLDEKMNLLRSFNIKPYIPIKFPYLRIPGYGEINRNDIAAFYAPTEVRFANDLKKVFIKRCVAVPGDTIFCNMGILYVNSIPEEKRNHLQQSYILSSKYELNKKNTIQWDLSNFKTQVFRSDIDEISKIASTFRYTIHISNDALKNIQKDSNIIQIKKVDNPRYFKNLDIYPHSTKFDWNESDWGPIILPRKGQTIILDSLNSIIYFDVIKNYEGLSKAEIKNGGIIYKGSVLNSYQFKNNYFFFVGDNRSDSYDSRYWGFVPQDNIVGYVWRIIYSRGDDGFRFSRFFKKADN